MIVNPWRVLEADRPWPCFSCFHAATNKGATGLQSSFSLSWLLAFSPHYILVTGTNAGFYLKKKQKNPQPPVTSSTIQIQKEKNCLSHKWIIFNFP